jgi:beta-glucanase (GH16 family)
MLSIRSAISALVALAAVVAPGCNSTNNDNEPGWQLVWADEFDTDGMLDTASWNYVTGGSGFGNNELQFYTASRPENARIENGLLVIEARKEDLGGNSYSSARVTTKGKHDMTYGRVEVRAKLPTGRGTWPAIWMLYSDSPYGTRGWPDNGEIDIMEHVGFDQGTVHATVHTKAFNHTIGTQVGQSVFLEDASTAFHVYAIEWTEDRIRAFVDDEQYFSFANSGNGWEEWPFDHRFHLILNIAIGGNWGGAQGVDDSIFPQRMEIDYVRFYE